MSINEYSVLIPLIMSQYTENYYMEQPLVCDPCGVCEHETSDLALRARFIVITFG